VARAQVGRCVETTHRRASAYSAIERET
jgi:hypothetical protein